MKDRRGLSSSLEANLGRLSMPVLILWGDHDRLIDVSCVDVLAGGLKTALRYNNEGLWSCADAGKAGGERRHIPEIPHHVTGGGIDGVVLEVIPAKAGIHSSLE
jgi:pimeloyl-ACP methyl ester carboxylesterase